MKKLYNSQSNLLITIFPIFNMVFFFRSNIWSSNIFLTKKNIILKHSFISVADNMHIYVDDLEQFDILKRKFFLYKQSFNTDLKKNKKSSAISFSNDSKLISVFKDDGGLVNPKMYLTKFLQSRFGVGNSLSTLLVNSTGITTNSFFNIDKLNDHFFYSNWVSFFYSSKNLFDISLVELKLRFFGNSKELYTYKGWCYKNNYPVHGQKRRSNYKTTRFSSCFGVLKRLQQKK